MLHMKKHFYTLYCVAAIVTVSACRGQSTISFPGMAFSMPDITMPQFPERQKSIVDYGAVGDGRTLNTNAINKTIQALAEIGGGRVLIPSGIWLTGPIVLKSHIDLHIEKNGLLLFSKNSADYPVVITQFEGLQTARCISPISGVDLENIAITGPGVIDGSGQAWRPVKKIKMTANQWKELVASGGTVSEDGKTWYPSVAALHGEALVKKLRAEQKADPNLYAPAKEYLRPVMISLVRCKRVLLQDLTCQNSPAWNIHPFLCEDVVVRNVTVRNPWYSQNGDGVDVESCRRVLLEGCSFDVGDDAICVKSGKDAEGRRLGRPCEQMVVRDCVVYHGHGGFTIGSEMSGGVRNVAVSHCTFIGTDMGLRFKSLRGRGGVVENIFIDNIFMTDIPTDAIGFNLFYSNNDPLTEASMDAALPAAVAVSEETPIFRRIYLKNIVCNGAGRALFLQGLPEMPIQQIELEQMTIASQVGLTAVDCREIKLTGLNLHPSRGPVFSLENSQDITMRQCMIPLGSETGLRVAGGGSRNIRLSDVDLGRAATPMKLEKDVSPDAVQRLP